METQPQLRKFLGLDGAEAGNQPFLRRWNLYHPGGRCCRASEQNDGGRGAAERRCDRYSGLVPHTPETVPVYGLSVIDVSETLGEGLAV